MQQIIRLQLGRIARRMRENHKAQFTYSDDLVDSIAGRCSEVESGARNVDHILTRTLLPEISQEFLSRMAAGRADLARCMSPWTTRGRFSTRSHERVYEKGASLSRRLGRPLRIPDSRFQIPDPES